MARAFAIALVVAGVTAAAGAAADDAVDRAGPHQTVLAHTASVTLSVSDPADAAKRITDAVAALGGRLVRGTDRELVVDVPNARYRELVARVAGIGDLRGQQLTTEDLTDAIATTAADDRAAGARRDRLEHMKAIARSVPENLLLERDIEGAADDVAQADRQLGELQRRGTVTRTTIHLVAPGVEPIAAPKLPFPWLDELGLPRLVDTGTRRTPTPVVLRSFIDGQIDLRGQRSVRGGSLGDPAGAMGLGLSMRDIGYAEPVGPFVGFDLDLGGGSGFLYRLQSVLGAGVPIGHRFAFALGIGPGVDGLTSHIPLGVDFPVELYVDLDATSFVGASAWVHDGWVVAAKARRRGSPHAPFGDESAAGLTLTFGTRDDYGSSSERMGLRLGFDVREAMGTQIYELAFGFGARHADVSGNDD